MRPRSIAWFEAAVLLELALAAVNTYLTWDVLAAELTASGLHFGVAIAIYVVALGLYLLLFWLVARRANNIARWIFAGLSVLGFLGLIDIAGLRAGGDLVFALTLAQYALAAISLWLLFRADSRDWFAGRSGVDPEIFR